MKRIFLATILTSLTLFGCSIQFISSQADRHCAHSHICCDVFSPCCPDLLYSELLRQNNSQKSDTKIDKAKFLTTIDIKHATKDGIYLNGYVVHIPYEKLIELNGKTVRISGKVTIYKGLKNYNDGVIRQGREEDTKHILKPKIKIKNCKTI